MKSVRVHVHVRGRVRVRVRVHVHVHVRVRVRVRMRVRVRVWWCVYVCVCGVRAGVGACIRVCICIQVSVCVCGDNYSVHLWCEHSHALGVWWRERMCVRVCMWKRQSVSVFLYSFQRTWRAGLGCRYPFSMISVLNPFFGSACTWLPQPIKWVGNMRFWALSPETTIYVEGSPNFELFSLFDMSQIICIVGCLPSSPTSIRECVNTWRSALTMIFEQSFWWLVCFCFVFWSFSGTYSDCHWDPYHNILVCCSFLPQPHTHTHILKHLYNENCEIIVRGKCRESCHTYPFGKRALQKRRYSAKETDHMSHISTELARYRYRVVTGGRTRRMPY